MRPLMRTSCASTPARSATDNGGLGVLVGNPDLRYETGSVQLCQSCGVDLVGFDARVGDGANQPWVGDDDAFDGGRMRRSTAALLPVTSMTTSSSRLSVLAKATSGSCVSSTRSCLVILPSSRIAT